MSDDWQGFRLMPDDVLFFRDGKPNSRGSDHYLRSLFPPNPSTLYGALRARRLLDEGVSLASLDEDVWRRLPADLRGELGDWGHFGSLEIRGPWPIRGDEPLLPAPSDLGLTFRERRPDERPSGRRRRGGLEPPRPPAIDQVARFRLPPDSGTGGGHSHDCKLLLPYLYNGSGWEIWPSDLPEPRPASGWFLTPKGLETWRQGKVPDVSDFVHHSELWADEMRTGLGLEEGDRRSEDHMLYTYGFVRLRQNVGIGFEVRGSRLTPHGTVRLGGEGRTCRLELGGAFPSATAKSAAASNGRLRLATATPALSETGGYLPGFSPETRVGALRGRRLELIGAVMGGVVLAGGWDLAKGRAKPLRRAMPPGSVFIFKDLEGNSIVPLDGICISGFSKEHLALQGFGLVVAGLEP